MLDWSMTKVIKPKSHSKTAYVKQELEVFYQLLSYKNVNFAFIVLDNMIKRLTNMSKEKYVKDSCTRKEGLSYDSNLMRIS